MKNLILLITAIAVTLLSCSNDDEQCTYTCNAWVRIENTPMREVIPLELDCETNQPINLPEGYIFLGCDNDNTP